MKVLQNKRFWEWAMLGSNQRPLPCEIKSITSWLFTAVQKLLQISIFSLTGYRECSLSFVWVGILIGVVRGVSTFESISTTFGLTASSPMTVSYPLVLSVRPVVRLKGVRKMAAAFSLGPCSLVGIPPYRLGDMQPPAADRHLFGRLLERVSMQETEHELRRKLLTGGSATMGRKESAGASVPRRSPPDWFWLQEAA